MKPGERSSSALSQATCHATTSRFVRKFCDHLLSPYTNLYITRLIFQSGAIKANSIQFSDKSVLALKATNEGPRRVLIVASRSQPITIRDAQSGLFLRTICGQKSHTVYSLMRDHNLIYCGTSSTSILVFDFTVRRDIHDKTQLCYST